jgi:hypothetical protein
VATSLCAAPIPAAAGNAPTTQDPLGSTHLDGLVDGGTRGGGRDGAQIGMQVRGQIGLWLKNENVIQIVVLHYDFIEYAMICDLWFSCFA